MALNPMEQAHLLLKQVFGYDSFRGLQAGVIEQVLDGRHVLAVMPTGTGKSLCYQIPALIGEGTTIVVSPLIALMQDQVSQLRARSVSAAALHSGLSTEETAKIEEALVRGKIKLLYLSPERALSPQFLEQVRSLRIDLIAIDEAHCVSQWGHDFRPDYLKLSGLFKVHPQAVRLALTATADGSTQKDIVRRLPMPAARVFLGGFDRPNIRYTIRLRRDEGEYQQVLSFLRRVGKGRGIVYCMSRRKVEETAAWLGAQGFPARPYHAGLEGKCRQLHHLWFQETAGSIMVATIAYGMGIDVPDIRFVIHLDLPKSIEAYYQETGRAGRDGLPAHAYMIYGPQDVKAQRRFIDKSQASMAIKQTEVDRLKSMVALCQTQRCRRQVLLEYFGDACKPCKNCDTCLPAAAPTPPSTLQKAARILVESVNRLRGKRAS